MKLSELIREIDARVEGSAETEIKGLCTDSTRVSEGDLFFCYAGGKHDSHDYAKDAVKGGAVALICERPLDSGVPEVIVPNARAAVALLARRFYGYADKKLKLVAVTGTNGKTTTTYMLKSIFDANSDKTAVIGTLGIAYGDKFISPELTTPDPIFLHSVFSDMVACGVKYVFMEVSAHAIYFDKTAGLKFEVGIFTNCTQDHLDFFGNMEDYAACKASFFKKGACALSVLNSDDALGARLMAETENAYSYGLENPADTFAVNVTQTLDKTTFVINLFDELYEIELALAGLHNVYNALAAATAAKLLGVKTETIARGLSALKTVSGRLERVAKYNGATVFVDFAHTPDGLEKSLSCLRNLCKGKLYCLFGCGGNRDTGKRPIMGEIAAKYADFVIITSDNPRYEDPYDIICQIAEGVKKQGGNFVSVTEREAATEYALKLLCEGDVLLVAGKGGETYQEIMGIKHDYNDNKIIKKIIS